ncbi:MAG: hypothetical protein GXO43_08790 [Crenarchaeota archaeon]|nr:hypothetical protein [Thermoproteota archaeon]
MDKTLFIIPCTSRKKEEDKYFSWAPETSIISRLDPGSAAILLASRRYIAEHVVDRNGYRHAEKPGPDLGYPSVIGSIGYLPAYERYSLGQTYRCLPNGFWTRLSGSGFIDALFVSGLYGLARYTEYIRYYDISIDQETIHGEPVYSIWRGVLPRIIASYAVKNGFDKVVVLTSMKYRYLMMPDLEWYLRTRGINVEEPSLGTGYEVLSNICYELRNRVENMLGSPEK